MPKNKSKQRKGTSAPADIVVGDKRKVIGLVSIQNDGRDERGAVLGTNGMRWVIA